MNADESKINEIEESLILIPESKTAKKIEPEEEFSSQFIVKPSRSRILMYGFVVGLGYAGLISEFFGAKFTYDANTIALNQSIQYLLELSPPSELIISLSIVSAGLSLGAYLTAIKPKANARVILSLKKRRDALVQIKNNKALTNNKNTQPGRFLMIKDIGEVLIFRAVPCFAMSIDFSVAASSTWLGLESLLRGYPWLNYFAGSVLVLSGIGYYILLSAKDVLYSVDELKNINKSSIARLFKKSKLIFLLPLSQASVAVFYRATTFSYVAGEIFENILGLGQYKLYAYLVTFIASSIIGVNTRFMPTFHVYLEPFKLKDGSYDLNLYSDKMVQSISSLLSVQDKIILRLTAMPIGLIRGLAAGYVIYNVTKNKINIEFLHEKWQFILPLIISLVAGGFLFSHAYYIRYKHNIYLKARNKLELENANNIQNLIDNQSDTQIQFGLKNQARKNNESDSLFMAIVIALFLNGGSQTARVFLAIASTVTLFGPYIGNINAAVLGLMIGTECGLTNFQYFQPKIEKVATQLLNEGKKRTKKWYQSSCSWFGYTLPNTAMTPRYNIQLQSTDEAENGVFRPAQPKLRF